LSRMKETVLELRGSRATTELGRAFGMAAPAGAVISLIGPLGAGKTTFVQGLAQGLGVSQKCKVTSPTFTLIKEYEGRLRLYHVDAYRLSGAAEMAELGAEELFSSEGLVVIEWADRVVGVLPSRRVDIRLSHGGPSLRLARVTPVGRPGRWIRKALDEHGRVAGTANRSATASAMGDEEA